MLKDYNILKKLRMYFNMYLNLKNIIKRKKKKDKNMKRKKRVKKDKEWKKWKIKIKVYAIYAKQLNPSSFMM